MTATYLTWIFPDRGTIKESTNDEQRLWSGYRGIAGELGLTFELCSPELIDVTVGADGATAVRVDGRPATIEDTIFVTEYQAFPHMVPDVWWQMITFQALAEAGFYLPVPPRWSAIANDKVATNQVIAPLLRETSLLPTARINAGRDAEERDLDDLLARISLPAVVKPSSWGGMRGLLEVRDPVELRCGLSLASAADLSVVVQPKLPDTLDSHRLYCVDQEIIGTRRYSTGEGHVLIGPRYGGQAEWVETPAEIFADATRIMAKVPAAYLCIDFLSVGERHYFSEIELDASIGAHLLADPTQREILRRRFHAYQRDHRAWVDRTAAA